MAEINRNPSFWDPATGYSDEVTVSNSGTSAVTVKRGSLLLSDGAGKYSLLSGNLSFTRGTSNRIAIALEGATVAKTSGTATVKAIEAGVVLIEEFYEATGYTTTTAPVAALKEFGGISNIVFVHTKEVK